MYGGRHLLPPTTVLAFLLPRIVSISRNAKILGIQKPKVKVKQFSILNTFPTDELFIVDLETEVLFTVYHQGRSALSWLTLASYQTLGYVSTSSIYSQTSAIKSLILYFCKQFVTFSRISRKSERWVGKCILLCWPRRPHNWTNENLKVAQMSILRRGNISHILWKYISNFVEIYLKYISNFSYFTGP